MTVRLPSTSYEELNYINHKIWKIFVLSDFQGMFFLTSFCFSFWLLDAHLGHPGCRYPENLCSGIGLLSTHWLKKKKVSVLPLLSRWLLIWMFYPRWIVDQSPFLLFPIFLLVLLCGQKTFTLLSTFSIFLGEIFPTKGWISLFFQLVEFQSHLEVQSY